MSAQFPPGWGFHATPKGEFDRACVEMHMETERMRREHRARQRERAKQERAALRNYRASRMRCMHIEFALWMFEFTASKGCDPTTRDVQDTFAVSGPTARGFINDFHRALARRQEQP